MLIAILLTAIVCAFGWDIYTTHYYGGKSVTSDEVEIELKESHGVTTLCFNSKDKNMIITVGYTENEVVEGKMPIETLNLIKRHPHSKGIEMFERQYNLYFKDEDTVLDLFSVANEIDFDEDDFFAIGFDDGVKTIKLSDLRDGNIENLK